jgi:hypothetical protein
MRGGAIPGSSFGAMSAIVNEPGSAFGDPNGFGVRTVSIRTASSGRNAE